MAEPTSRPANGDGNSPASIPKGKILVTGATGMLGSHIAEQLRRRGDEVVALCRNGSDTSFLHSIGVRTVAGDLADVASIRAACEGVDTIYHSAARVGDWGPWPEFVSASIDGTRNMLEAASAAGVRRFLHISSISAYGHINGDGLVLDESAPLGQKFDRWSYYSRAKYAAEKLVWKAHETGLLQVTVIRPSWLYGERDRATLGRMIDAIRRGRLRLVSGGRNRLNVTNAANVAEAAILAANSERAIGEAYNVCHDGELTQKEYFNLIARTLGEKELTRSIPYAVAYRVAFVLECIGHLLGSKRPPLATRYAVWLLGRQCFFECSKIKEQLGWSSTITYQEGIRDAVLEQLAHQESDDRAGLAPAVPETPIDAGATPAPARPAPAASHPSPRQTAREQQPARESEPLERQREPGR